MIHVIRVYVVTPQCLVSAVLKRLVNVHKFRMPQKQAERKCLLVHGCKAYCFQDCCVECATARTGSDAVATKSGLGIFFGTVS